jgi:hypothetical protein
VTWLAINSHKVKINLMDTSFASELSKECSIFSILDHILRILNNSSIYPKLYFSGVESEEKLDHGMVKYGKNLQCLEKHHKMKMV